MATGALTFDDYGFGPSKDFEERARQYDPSILQEALQVSSGASRDISRPLLTSHADALFNYPSEKNVGIEFPPPVEYDSTSRLFRLGLAPRLGSETHIDILRQRVDSTISEKAPPHTHGVSWEHRRQMEEREEEASALHGTLDILAAKASILAEINGERTHYQKA